MERAHPERARRHRALRDPEARRPAPTTPRIADVEPAAPKRYLVVAALFVLSLITVHRSRGHFDREGSDGGGARRSRTRQMGAVFSAFALGYAAAQIPSGWFADRIGPRRALAIVVVLWSLFTALTGAMTRLAPLLAVRFLFGVAEAGAYPGSARVFYNWLPASRARHRQRRPVLRRAARRRRWRFRSTHGCWSSTTGAARSTSSAIPALIWAVCWMIWFRDFPARADRARDAARSCRAERRDPCCARAGCCSRCSSTSPATSRSTSASPGCTPI